MFKKIFPFLIFAVVFVGCEDLIEPAKENNRGLDNMQDNASYAEGILLNGYTRVPTNSWSFTDVATDNAVTNNDDNDYRRMATGQWAADFNPMGQWQNCFAGIQYMNIMLDEADDVQWAEDEQVRRMFNDRIKGEAYGLRALFYFYLLQAHGGWTADGQLLGVPLILEPQDKDTDFENLERASFTECMQQIYDDLDRAEELLPLDYDDVGEGDIPEKYKSEGVNANQYNRVFGHYNRLRMTARIVKGYRAKAALLAASPSYNEGTNTSWADVADYAAEVIDLNGGLSGLASNGFTWYTNTDQISNIGGGENPPEILWRAGVSGADDTDLESEHFPPTLYGNGRVNPTQNLVDAFPMANGYPIDHPSSGYDPDNPYTGRDPRLEEFIIYNGSTAGVNDETINTSVDGGTNDGLNAEETSTRTGYYMRKLLRQDVNLDPQSTNGQRHYKPHIRYTEIYLIYAEAANEAWGPDGTGSHAYSARDVISAIRSRAGIESDDYLASIGNKDDMRQLIHNERRLELCFEDFRFWDLRRWEKDLTETAMGVRIEGGTPEVISVENRDYEDFMYHGPVPYNEMLKFDALIQNQGW